ncbi:SDR family NAD(P)-dependent oxidoreductase [Bradyrhizobium sp. LHD-71]|uniref:SDR family NAD(P)-dependent oxidoreductase n=1 Tax=Bradyrhizobium sp. LHD-71 TaxID=3072141 RepID=UPI00280FE179|nr:SDR family NAD(P)-dependent oxidoreductase [Bradyrhizobium sp. LHD-71]MDQ8728516.1 SDR family NAD(P)-dependent oxidoreductase [Bradyrhizobium sp. LHD-71]
MTKVALVTGAGRGIGRACALTLAGKGFDIALVDLLAPEMTKTADDIRRLGVRALTFQADVSSFTRAHEIVDAVVSDRGRLDVLVNNAGAPSPKPIIEISEEEFDRAIAVNLKSCFNYIHAAAPVFLNQAEGGRIVSISSLNALSGGVTSAVSKHAYAAAKAGILGLTRSLAKELGPKVAVNAVCPGIIATELLRDMISRREEDLVSGIALGRVGTPEDVASIVSYLATDAHMFITGQHFVVDGFQWKC